MVYIFILTIVSIFRYCKIIVIILIVKNNKDIILLIEKSGGDVGDYEVVGKACLGGGGGQRALRVQQKSIIFNIL